MNICGIYKITDKTTQQIYIGQSNDIAQRWKEHLKSLDNTDIHFALRNNILNFTFEVIELCKEEDLNIREKYWISFYNSYEKGFNMTPGGKTFTSPKNKRPVEQYDLQGNYIASYESIKQAQEINHNYHIGACCRGERVTAGGYQWVFTEVKPGENTIKFDLIPHSERPITQYDLKGIKIKDFNSIVEAAKETNINYTSILKVCQKKGHTAGGYRWSYIEDKLEITKEHTKGIKRKIMQISKDTQEVINVFDSISDAAKSLNKSVGSIGDVCRGKRKSAYGYIWKYKQN